MEHQPRIAITMGDPAGIGPEIIVKAFNNPPTGIRCLVVGDKDLLGASCRRFAPDLKIRSVTDPEQARFDPGTIDILNTSSLTGNVPPGNPGAEGGRASVSYIRSAVDLALNQQVDAITTAPISKESIHLAGYFFPGHTEMLAEFCGVRDVGLMLAGNNLRVVLATTHVPLQEVGPLITIDRVATILRITHRWLLQHVGESPRIAVTGLNPHCGDGGIFGREESQSIIPALEQVHKEGIQADGPFSADALFAQKRYIEYDAVVTMYHDQGMIPVKMESSGKAVNITLGLPIIRTSVDHGTAFDIAGKGQASETSLLTAIECAARLCKPTFTVK